MGALIDAPQNDGNVSHGLTLTLEMMMPAMEILTLGPFRSLYLRSIPFQKEMTYRLMAMLSFPCNLTTMNQ